jgi:hypothetical protein
MWLSFKTVRAEVKQGDGVVASVFNFFQGRATAFAIVFSIVGIVLAFTGQLTTDFSLFVASIQTLVFAHSCKEDWHEQRMTALQQQPRDSTSVPGTEPVPPADPCPTKGGSE